MSEQHENPLLGFLRSRFQSVGDVFRTNPRYKSTVRVHVTWVADERTSNLNGRMIDISRAGAALQTNRPIPAGVIVRLCLTGGAVNTPWIEAHCLASDPAPDGYHRVRLQFCEPCPTIFLKSAVLDHIAADEPSSVEHYESTLE